MKKNININISGIIFYIEEDGYDKLKEYLMSIHKYFSAFEDSGEIIADIENRIAEIFLSKLGENRQVITIEDIEDLVTTMGSVADFQAIEDDNFVKSSTKSANSSASQSKNEKQTNKNTTSSFNFDKTDADYQTNYSASANQSSYTTTESRKLLRDNKRKLLGGVASGIAHYLSVDPLWVRLMFLATLFDWFFFVSISGVAFFSYILIWALVPASNDLEDDSRVKKLFRNPENKVLGGVAGGLAAYFGVEVTLVRVLLALGMFLGGTTVIAYCILWAITPEAKTLTEKMEMEGEPITLKNIEEKIKENLNIDHDKEETLFAKILLFPFRLIAQIFAILTPLIQPFGGFVLQALRVVLGAGFVVKGFALIVAFTVALLAFTGYFDVFMTNNPNGLVYIDGFPLAMMRELAPTFGIYSMYVVLLIPSISLVIIGISLIAKRKIVGNIFAWSLFGVWIVSLAVASAAFADVAKKFKTQQTVEKATNYNIKSKLLVLDLIEQEEGFPNEDVSLTIKGYEGETAQLIRFITARGENKEIATANAGMVSYTVKEENDKLIFSRYFGFKDAANYRGQNLSLKLYLPYNQEFTMTDKLASIISNTVSPYGYDRDDITDEARWVFKEEQGLICLNCKKKPKNDEDDDNSNEIDESETSKNYDFKDFDALVINSTIDMKIEQGNEFSVKAYSDSEDFEGIKVVQNGRTLTIDATESQNPDMIITLPKLVSCVVNGDGELVITNFVGETLLLTVSDASDVDARLNFDNLICKLNGKANLDLSGKAKNCDFYIDGASTLDAGNFTTQTGKIEANGASNAEITAEKTFEVNSLGVSSVEIQGNATVKGRGNYKKEE